jgi:voltage-gated potassium channel
MTSASTKKHSWLYRMLEPEGWGRPGLSPVNAVLIFLVLFSFVDLALETEPTTPPEVLQFLDYANTVVIAIFGIEYVLRFIVAGEDPRYRGVLGRVRYVFSFYALADLAAFLPEAILLLHGDHMTAQTVAMLKALRLLRLFKIARYMPAFDIFLSAIRRSWEQLGVALALALAFVYVGAMALYFVEGHVNPEQFGSIPRALWWAVVTLTTVGYGDAYPVTVLGRVAAGVIAVAGIGIVALPAGIMASAFSDELRHRHEKAERAREEGQREEDRAA